MKPWPNTALPILNNTRINCVTNNPENSVCAVKKVSCILSARFAFGMTLHDDRFIPFIILLYYFLSLHAFWAVIWVLLDWLALCRIASEDARRPRSFVQLTFGGCVQVNDDGCRAGQVQCAGLDEKGLPICRRAPQLQGGRQGCPHQAVQLPRHGQSAHWWAHTHYHQQVINFHTPYNLVSTDNLEKWWCADASTHLSIFFRASLSLKTNLRICLITSLKNMPINLCN